MGNTKSQYRSTVFFLLLLGFSIALLLSAICQGAWEGADNWYTFLGSASEAVTALAALAALGTYFYQRRKDKIDAVIELLQFTREKIVPIRDQIDTAIVSAHKIYAADRLSTRIEGFDLRNFKVRHPEITYQQTLLYFSDKSQPYAAKVNELANLLEEFALRALNQNASGLRAMDSIMPLFVQSVEDIVIYMLIQGLVPGNGTFPGCRKLYLSWRDASCIVRDRSILHRRAEVRAILSNPAPVLQITSSQPTIQIASTSS